MRSTNIHKKIKGKLILAPMDGFTNIAYRLLCKDYGADIVCTEMISSDALAHKNNATLKKAFTCREERPVSLQLFGLNIKNIEKAVNAVEPFADIIDFNMGCPVKKITSQGYGAALLKKPEKIKKIVETLSSSTDKPVSVKIRSDFALRNAKIIEKAGASFIVLHARKWKQKYSGKADWQIIKKVKSSVSIPVVGNGDIRNELDAEKMLEICDAAMIGRAAMGDPMIFQRCKFYLKNNDFLKPLYKDKTKALSEYLKLAEKFKIKFSAIKSTAICFTRGLKSAKKLRNGIIKCNDINCIRKMFNKEV